MKSDSVKAIVWNDPVLSLLDQRLLPRMVEYIRCETPDQVGAAIREMVVRGAPAIGCCAAYGVALAARDISDEKELTKKVMAAAADLRKTRPTAVNLNWAIDRMLLKLESVTAAGGSSENVYAALVREAESIFEEDLDGNRRIGRFGSSLIQDSATVLTHCNAGSLATSGYGTALGVIRAAHESGKKIAVFADETRPYLQGARLTAWELMQDGIDVTLIADNMSGHFFQKGTFDAVIVGADRIAANGDTANKIGTYMVAVLARAHNVPFYVAAPVSTIDLHCPDGAAIPIEERSAVEMTETRGWDEHGQMHTISVAPQGIATRHPAFDVTPSSLISAIITDRGIIRAPYLESVRSLFP
ncbi:MAG TPA: S-methyl-5-thioribose-1-phosphate isomerase [Thermoanaerobaculia bacterium]|nr:S-methyl-5-thioribose-1-phosphate isomerase [Thermoanaerobaculia bacterium]